MAPKDDGPIALRRASNDTYFMLVFSHFPLETGKFSLPVPSPATFPFLCSLTPVGRRSALLQQQLGAKGKLLNNSFVGRDIQEPLG